MTMVRLGGWITQLSHPRSDGRKTKKRVSGALLRSCTCKLKLCRVPVMKTSDSRWQHFRLVSHPPSRDVGASATTRTGRRRSKASVRLLTRGYGWKMWDLWAAVACRVLGIASNVLEGPPPLLPDKVQPTSRELWLALQVEFAEEPLSDRLQRLPLATECHREFILVK